MEHTKSVSTRLLLLFFSIIIFSQLSAQEELIKVESGIQISNSINPTPESGTIRWTGSDFQGWNGVQWVSLTGGQTVGSVSDTDGNAYKTYIIGNQEWMIENLKTTKYSDGSQIYHADTNNKWKLAGENQQPAFSWYLDNEATYKEIYGGYYNWYAVSSSSNGGKSLCPIGWHVPSKDEWIEMIDYLGGFGVAGGKMKAVSSLWQQPNNGATNESGFTAIPGGWRSYLEGSWLGNSDSSFTWSKTEYSFNLANSYSIRFNDSTIGELTPFKSQGFNVRCLTD